jgi:alpha-ketoglutarate-dependent taurine dioxygenase
MMNASRSISSCTKSRRGRPWPAATSRQPARPLHRSSVLEADLMRVQPLARALGAGAVITDIDLRAARMTPSLWEGVREAFAEFHFLHFPGQAALQPSDQLHFAQQFPHDEEHVKTASGPIQSPFSLTTLPQHPLVMAQGNCALADHYGLTAQLEAADLAVESGLEWHTDNIDSPTQSVLTSLHCLAATRSGGETMFAAGPAVFSALSAEQQRLASTLTARYTRWDETNAQRAAQGLSKIQAMMLPDGIRLAPGAPHPLPGDTVTAEHPLVRWSERRGQQHGSLVTTPSILHSLRRATTGEVLGYEESRDTLAELLQPGTALHHAEAAAAAAAAGDGDDGSSGGRAWAHVWQRGDLVCWDNRWMIHSTTSPLLWVGDRLMHRIRLPAPPAPSNVAAASL